MFTLINRDQLTTLHQKEGLVTGNLTSTASQLSYTRKGTLVGYFDGPLRFMDYLNSEMSVAQRDRASVNNERDDFNAFKSYEEAMDTFRNKARSLLGFKESELVLRDDMDAGIGVEYAHTGDYVDVGRYLEGEPECFGVMVDGNPRGRRVNLVLNGSWVWSTKPAAIIARSRRIQRLVDWLENQQVRTSIRHIESHSICHIEILIKDHDEVLDMRDVAVVSHPEFLRRLVFRFDEYSPTFSSGYGSSKAFGDHINEKPEVLYPTMDSEITLFIGNNPDKKVIEREFDEAEKYLASQITKSGTEAEDRFKQVSQWGGW